MVTVIAPITLNPATLGDQTFMANILITPLTLPAATGGTPPYTYTLSPIPPGLAFNAASRSLSGTPTTAGITKATYTAIDANRKTASLTFTVTVIGPIAFNPPTIPDQTFTVDTLITPLTLPRAIGGTPPYIYTLSPIPPGLAFNAASRSLSGTPTTIGTTKATYTATDASGQIPSLIFTITVIGPITFNPATIDDQTFTVDKPVTLTLPTATGGTPPYTYTLSPIPPGLAFVAEQHSLAGTPTTVGVTDLTYTATDATDAAATLNFTIEVIVDPLDVNSDGQVTVIDLAIVALFYGTQVQAGTLPADVNADGIVNILDLTAVAQGIDAIDVNLEELSLEAVAAALAAAAEQAAE